MLVPQLTRPRSQVNTEQSNQMARHHPFPQILFPAMILKDVQQYTRILFCQRSQHPRRMLVLQLSRPQSQFNTYQSTGTIVDCYLGWMSNGGTYSKGVLSRHTLLSHTLTEKIIDWSCFNEAPTCSKCNQEDEGQMSGHSFIVRIKKNSTRGVKYHCQQKIDVNLG